MSSSRESTPLIESAVNSPLQLTPTSKVKALLATLDNDSDGEGDSESARTRVRTALAKDSSSESEVISQKEDGLNSGEKDTKGVSGHEEENAEDEEEDEDVILRPAGRMAARMLQTEDVSEADHEQSSDDARERVRKMLKVKTKTLEPTSEKGDDEDEGPIIPRKRKIRTSRRGTPASSERYTGLFVSPRARRSPSVQDGQSDSEDLPLNPVVDDDRFKALVARKREERVLREKEEAEKKAKEVAARKRATAMFNSEEESSDGEMEKKLTQSQRPTRKANKRAMEEIKRETQRMSRNMQLTHKAVTKKQFKKASLFARFNFKTAGAQEDGDDSKTLQVSDPIRPASSSSAAHSDVDMHDTPPTSPATQTSDLDKNLLPTTSPNHLEGTENLAEDYEMPTLEEVVATASIHRVDKGKGKAVHEPIVEEKPKKKYSFTRRPINVRRSETIDGDLYGSDNDLEIIGAKTPDAKRKKLNAIFDRIPAKQAREPHSLQALKMLAHLTSPGKQNLGKNKKPSITNSEMQLSLQQKARQQASREKEERLQALRDKGIIIQTAEERAKEMAEVENLISKARREGEEIMQREKAAAKKERKANGEVDPLGDSSDDEDWEEEKENLVEESSGSGSEDEMDVPEEEDSDMSGEDADDEEAEDEALDHDVPAQPKNMFDNEADETDDDEGEEDEADDKPMLDVSDVEEEEEDDDALPVNQASRRTRKSNIISDDEDDDEGEDTSVMETPIAPRTESPRYLHTDSPIAPNSVLRSATKTFIPGVTVAGPAGLGLTQIFAGTMDESQMDNSQLDASTMAVDPVTPGFGRKNDSMAFFKQFAVPELPPFMPTMPSMDEDSQDVVMDSQSMQDNIPESQGLDSQTQAQAVDLSFSQSQIHGFDSLIDPLSTQMSDFPDATQDVGFQHMTPIRGRFVEPPPSTVDTVVLGSTTIPETMEETPIAKKKGKLRRRLQVTDFSDEEDVDESGIETAPGIVEGDPSTNVFDVMRKASKPKKIVVDEFDKKKSEAKTMINEQAEESEDEYAGLGGASDDESGGEADEYVKEMIDDEGGQIVDEGKLAAFFADRERANDEKQVEKLYNDISKGMLRRRRGADYDLSDSDDGGEARRRMKQKKFAKMQRALLADEKIGKIAENPKKRAFLRAIEDRGSEDEMDFLGDFAEQEDAGDSQSQSQADDSQRVPDSQPDTTMGPPKRKRSDDAAEAEMRPPPNLRRTKPAKKPSNISEIRESLSSLIEEPNQMLAPQNSDSETDDDLEIEGGPDTNARSQKDKENRDPFALRRTSIQTVDRIALKRASSSSLSANARLAFSANSSAPGFKVPALLRRATTNSSVSSISTTNSGVSGGMSTTERMAGGAAGDGIKRGGGKHSGVNYFARESERKAAVMKTEKRREQKRFQGAEVRRKVVGGLFGGGKFE